MAIYAPGKRGKRNKLTTGATKRKLVAQLSLTAMVDMFTVLVVFLLMNYRTTETILYLPKEVELPKATETKELKPAHVVTISTTEILIDREPVASFGNVQSQDDWMVPGLRDRLIELFRQAEIEHNTKFRTQLRQATIGNKALLEKEKEALKKVTIQADKDIDFLTVKKIMYTVTEAGAREINFAVISQPRSEEIPALGADQESEAGGS